VKLFKFVLLINAMAVLLNACATNSTDPFIAFKGQSAERIYQNAKLALGNRDYAQAIKSYEALEVLYPFNRHSECAWLELMYSYYQHGDAPAAKAEAERFIHLYPCSAAVDYAYYMQALADMDQDRGWYLRYVPIDLSRRDAGTMRLAFQEFAQLIERYPQSCYVADARQRMVYLRNLFASYELHIADYYFRKKAYVAAANRANEIVQRYQGAPEVKPALIIMIKSYCALGIKDLADQSMAVFRLNFPGATIP
jgi:outer membrane protein assembly factor BamD